MEQIEIRRVEGKLVFYIVLIVIVLVGNNYYFFFSPETMNIRPIWKLFLCAANVWLAYRLFQMVSAAIKDEPVISMGNMGMKINEINLKISMLWPDITNWQIIEDENTYYLLIELFEKKKKVNISGLEKNHAEIEQLLNHFKPKKLGQ
jgi:hypothetical protein